MITEAQAITSVGLLFFLYVYVDSLKKRKDTKSQILSGLFHSIILVVTAYVFALAELTILMIIMIMLNIIYWIAYGADWFRMVFNQYKGEDERSLQENIKT